MHFWAVLPPFFCQMCKYYIYLFLRKLLQMLVLSSHSRMPGSAQHSINSVYYISVIKLPNSSASCSSFRSCVGGEWGLALLLVITQLLELFHLVKWLILVPRRKEKDIAQKCHFAQSSLTRTIHVTLTNHKERPEKQRAQESVMCWKWNEWLPQQVDFFWFLF